MRLIRLPLRDNLLPHERGIQVVNCALAVATHCERVGHVARTIFAQIKSVLPVVWVVRVTIRHNHFRKRNAPEDLNIYEI